MASFQAAREVAPYWRLQVARQRPPRPCVMLDCQRCSRSNGTSRESVECGSQSLTLQHVASYVGQGVYMRKVEE